MHFAFLHFASAQPHLCVWPTSLHSFRQCKETQPTAFLRGCRRFCARGGRRRIWIIMYTQTLNRRKKKKRSSSERATRTRPATNEYLATYCVCVLQMKIYAYRRRRRRHCTTSKTPHYCWLTNRNPPTTYESCVSFRMFMCCDAEMAPQAFRGRLSSSLSPPLFLLSHFMCSCEYSPWNAACKLSMAFHDRSVNISTMSVSYNIDRCVLAIMGRSVTDEVVFIPHEAIEANNCHWSDKSSTKS